MSILIFAIIVILSVAMVVYAVDYLPLAAPFNGIAKFLIILIGALLILSRAGLV